MEISAAAKYYGMLAAERKAYETKIIEHPKIGVGICVRFGDYVLLVKRKGDHQGGKWSFPGGHLEMFEEPEVCALRELREECGEDIRVTVPRFLAAVNTPYPEEGRHYVVLFYVCDYINGKPINAEPEKHDEVLWFSWYYLPSPLIQGLEKLKKKYKSVPR